ncbi:MULTISPECIES: NUDIX domain-containing protein [Roseivirga]|jgi:ADP-ribose pyrophosphatase YjhB (NUDIX family)|uniref:NUDIX hydrolase n=1 Tax=Roseivirga TaxID=290180 RepID=UPI00257C7DF1|nr:MULTISPECIES: NUDIX domain-containing protein [Roseivirga]MEC7753113.1 NUDIX domain-containing protein [Bacteroidota bacterium]|tara:strand:+ start:4858 stop:5268 length:411 start_codon:yes stop_codon:yes gene_type:complete
METKTTIIDKLAWLEIVDGKILVARSKGKDTFYIPGGKREPGESDDEALMREIEEELSVALLPNSLEYYGTFEAQAHGKPEGVVVQMTCYWGKYQGKIEPASEIEEIRWLNFADKQLVSWVDRLIFDDLLSKGLLS